MSTFSGLNAAGTALQAARRGLDIVGQNIANQNTAGYTRQRVDTSAVAPVGVTSKFTAGARAGEGVSIDGINRIGDAVLDSRVRDALGVSGFWTTKAAAASAAEKALAEPTTDGLAHKLSQFWAGFQDLANSPDSVAAASTVLTSAQTITTQIAEGYRAVSDQWSQGRVTVDRTVDAINAAADQIAALNGTIRDVINAGGTPNELIDQRNLLAQNVARLAGATGTVEKDGTLTLRVDGNALVAGDKTRHLVANGPVSIEDGLPTTISWENGTPAAIRSGELGGQLEVIAPDGVLANLADTYNQVATAIAGKVNALHTTGVTVDGTPGGQFFALAAGVPAAVGLSVVPTSRDEMALAAPGAGPLDGSIADKIGAIGLTDDGPDAIWSGGVAALAVSTAAEVARATAAETSAVAAASAQQSVAAVDGDEEAMNLLTFQTQYQAAARVVTAIDETLDVLLRMGVVGR